MLICKIFENEKEIDEIKIQRIEDFKGKRGVHKYRIIQPEIGELCLLATHKEFPKRKKPVKQLVVASRGRHSAKPSEVRNKIVELMGDLPRIELFARPPKGQLFEDESFEGWDCIGNDIDGCDIRESLDKLIKGVGVKI